jgi:hypothetical protein
MLTRTRTLLGASLISAALLLGSGSSLVSAHEGHSACPGGAPAVVDEGLFPASTHNDQGISGEAAALTAQAGLVDEALVGIHAAFCEPAR